jgi:hypothetical protein
VKESSVSATRCTHASRVGIDADGWRSSWL